MRKTLYAFILLLAAGLPWACTGSGAVSPLSPSRAATPEVAPVTDNQVVYWSAFPMASPLTDTLNGVCLLSKKSGWACGNNGVVLRFDGDSWDKMDTGLAKNENLMALAFAGENEGWAVGSHGTILHYNNGAWSLDNSQTQELLYSLVVTPSKTVWVVGANGTILSYNGVSWGKITGVTAATAGTTLTEDLYDVGMSGQNNGWAVGNRGTILRFDGQKWQAFTASPSTERLNSVSVINDSQAWIVGAFGTILRFNGTTWNKMGSAFSGVDLYQVHMKSDDDGWAVGQDGTLLYYDGTRWIAHAKPDGKPGLNGIAFYKDLGFVVGQNGSILRYQPNGEMVGFSFLFKGFASKEGSKAPYQWKAVYSLFNQSAKASPLVSFSVQIPQGLEAYLPEVSPTPTGTIVPTPVPTFTSTPSAPLDLRTAAMTPTLPKIAETGKTTTTMTGGWKMKDDRLEWEIGNIAASENKSLSFLLREKKGEKKNLPVVIKAVLKSTDKVVSEAAPVTLLEAPKPAKTTAPDPTPHGPSTPAAGH